MMYGSKTSIEVIGDSAFGIITGCVYAGFLQAYQNQQLTPGLEDMKEFNQIIKQRAPLIKKALLNLQNKPKDNQN